MKRIPLTVIATLLSLSAWAQPKTDSLLEALIRKHASPLLQHILQYPDSFRYQLIYTQIDRDKHNRPHFKQYYFHVDADNYFNPASTVKLPVAVMAMEKLHALHKRGLNIYTPMLTDSAYPGQVMVHTDSTARNGLPSVAHYIKKIFLVSDNNAYNRLYEFVGQQAIHESLWAKGYSQVRIVRRFMPLDEEGNRHTNPIRFMKGNRLIYAQPAAYCNLPFDFSKTILIGNAHWNRRDSLVQGPFDFTKQNNFPLEDIQHVLQSILFPKSVPKSQRFNLTKADYRFLYHYMSALPRESDFPKYDTVTYFDSFTKFFMFKANQGKIPPYIRVFNKTGWAFGFLTDAAYIVDFKHKVEFMLTGTVYVNRDGVLNDNRYEYETEGYPFFKEIGKTIYQYELERKRTYTPDLQDFAKVR
ncbi:MAG TPA: serine hydrolase [Chitinophaga sp.]|uniref:serine hydrolase n=1 Tax=Chitinophaga sp. TaxID=1869181 RepID=UPI002DBABCB3|nr:serine hydrolase [Chitinophaga sp.]HEU4552928.1 serine hydrolase [Chitinophaga sp.]